MFNKMMDNLKNRHNKTLVTVIIAVGVILLLMIVLRIYESISLKNKTLATALPVVTLIEVAPNKKNEQIVLPGNVQAWHSTTLYARTNGYLKKWYADIGSHVHDGDLLAEIEAPELDAQFRQAQADLNTAMANNKLAQSTAARWTNLLKSQSVSKQEADEKVSAAKALDAVVNSARANYERLQGLVSFEKVTAPFDGVITSRAVDVGALISTGVALFDLAQTNPLRVYVRIPQSYTSQIKPKMTVNLQFSEYPGQQFPAKLIDTAQAIDPASRTLLAQFEADNKSGKLLPGAYAEVHFDLPASKQKVRIPINSLLFRAEGLRVASLDKDNKVVLKPVKINRDFGTEVEINDGIKAGDKIILNPSDSLMNGDKVQVAQ